VVPDVVAVREGHIGTGRYRQQARRELAVTLVENRLASAHGSRRSRRMQAYDRIGQRCLAVVDLHDQGCRRGRGGQQAPCTQTQEHNDRPRWP
jgi:hypothetical protein